MKNKTHIFRFIYSEILFKLRINLALIIVKTLGKIKKNSRQISFFLKNLDNLKKKGYCHNDGYLTNKEINFIDAIAKEASQDAFNKNYSNSYLDIEKIEGSIKIKHLSNHFKEVKRFSSDNFFTFMSFIFNLNYFPPVEIFNFSSDGTKNDYNLNGKCIENIASHPHRDLKPGFKHYLKAVILLDNVNENNGPTKLIPNTSNMIDFGDKIDFTRETADKLINEKSLKDFSGKKGDMIIFDSSNIHWASNLNSGNRKLLWLYF